jgi:hypothetical protein
MTPTIGTIKTTDGVPTSAPNTPKVRYVLCSEDPQISYNSPKPGQEEDRANAFDTDQTVGDPKTRGTIRNHNAVVLAACGGAK